VKRWEQGRAQVQQMLDDNRLTPTHASPELAQSYIDTARRRLLAVESIQEIDPAGAFVLTYDGARLGMAAILINQGLRPRGEGAHAILLEVVLAQLEPPRQQEFREFAWMRRLRNDTHYPDVDRPLAGPDDLAQAMPATLAIVDCAEQVIPHMPPFASA